MHDSWYNIFCFLKASFFFFHMSWDTSLSIKLRLASSVKITLFQNSIGSFWYLLANSASLFAADNYIFFSSYTSPYPDIFNGISDRLRFNNHLPVQGGWKTTPVALCKMNNEIFIADSSVFGRFLFWIKFFLNIFLYYISKCRGTKPFSMGILEDK